MTTELHAGQQAGAALASSTPRPEQMIWLRPAAPKIPIECLLRLIPEAEAKLYRALTELIPAPSMVAPNLACRQIKMAKLAKLAGLSQRWVIELLVRLEERDLIRTDGGSGAAKWIWLLRFGVPRLGKSSPTELTQKEKNPEPSPGKAKAQQAAATQPKRRRQETLKSAKPVASAQVAPPDEKPVEILKRRQEAPLPSTPPADPSSGGPVLATKVTPALPTAPGSLAVPAAMVTPPTPTAPASRAAQAAMVTPPPPAATVMPPPPAPAARAVQAPPPAAPAAPAKPASRQSIKKIPARRLPKKKAATIEELVAYLYPQPWPPNLIRDLKPPVMTAEELPFALHLLCRQPRRFNNRADFVSALRSALHEYLAQTSWYL